MNIEAFYKVMASNKTGFNYYNIDTDRYQDIRIKKLKKEFGCNGIAVYDYILCEIYRVKGCFLEWDESTAFDVSDYLALSEKQVMEIVGYCCNVGLFNKELRASERILTSTSIQSRYIEMCKRAKRKEVIIPDKYKIIQEESIKSPEESEEIQEECDRVEYSKVEESKEEKREARAKSFYGSLLPHLDQYGKELLRAFYDYWAEWNKSQTRMRWELQATWEVAKRLATWAKRDKDFAKKQLQNEPELNGKEYREKREAMEKRARERSNS